MHSASSQVVPQFAHVPGRSGHLRAEDLLQQTADRIAIQNWPSAFSCPAETLGLDALRRIADPDQSGSDSLDEVGRTAHERRRRWPAGHATPASSASSTRRGNPSSPPAAVLVSV